jgi:hypothetical protein
MSLLNAFAQQVIASHGLVVITIQSGEQPDLGTFIELGAELLAIHKLASLQSQEVSTVKETRELWLQAHECFRASETLWHQLSSGGELPELHARLLHRLCSSTTDMLNIYAISETDRLAYRKRKVDPPPVAENSNGAARRSCVCQVQQKEIWEDV